MPIFDAVRMGTLTPASIIGEEKNVGSLEVGKLADVCVLDKNFEVKKIFIAE